MPFIRSSWTVGPFPFGNLFTIVIIIRSTTNTTSYTPSSSSSPPSILFLFDSSASTNSSVAAHGQYLNSSPSSHDDHNNKGQSDGIRADIRSVVVMLKILTTAFHDATAQYQQQPTMTIIIWYSFTVFFCLEEFLICHSLFFPTAVVVHF